MNKILPMEGSDLWCGERLPNQLLC